MRSQRAYTAPPIHHPRDVLRASRFRRVLANGLVATLLGAAGSAYAVDPLPLPPLVDPASQEHHPGKVTFVELVTPDIPGAERFYGQLFGWTFRDIQAGSVTYAQASLDGRPVAGLIHRNVPAGQQRQPAWLTFIASRDVDATRTLAVQQGAKVLAEPHAVPDRGREAVFADPQGAVFAVVASTGGDPPDELAEPGEWIWSSLITSDPEHGAAFYQALFGYDVFELGDTDAQHLMLATEDYARASANGLPPGKPNARPHWLNYVRVDNAVEMTAKAVALGGRVLVEPRDDRHGGKVAVVADPTGAPFGLLEWTATQTKEVPQ